MKQRDGPNRIIFREILFAFAVTIHSVHIEANVLRRTGLRLLLRLCLLLNRILARSTNQTKAKRCCQFLITLKQNENDDVLSFGSFTSCDI